MIQGLVRRHYLELWGPPSRRAEHIFNGQPFEVWKWDADRIAEGVTLYTTIGASSYPLPGWPASHRFELFLGLQPPEDGVATALAGAASFIFRTDKLLEPGHTVTFSDMALWPTTAMRTFLVRQPREWNMPTLLAHALQRWGGGAGTLLGSASPGRRASRELSGVALGVTAAIAVPGLLRPRIPLVDQPVLEQTIDGRHHTTRS